MCSRYTQFVRAHALRVHWVYSRSTQCCSVCVAACVLQCVCCSVCVAVYRSISSVFKIHTECTGSRREIGCLILIGHFPQKSPIISGSFWGNDLQLEASYESSPPCTLCEPVHICTYMYYITYSRYTQCVRVHVCVCVCVCAHVCACVCVCVYVQYRDTLRWNCIHMQDLWQGTATHCNTLQHTSPHCNTLQHTATLCVQYAGPVKEPYDLIAFYKRGAFALRGPSLSAVCVCECVSVCVCMRVPWGAHPRFCPGDL